MTMTGRAPTPAELDELMRVTMHDQIRELRTLHPELRDSVQLIAASIVGLSPRAAWHRLATLTDDLAERFRQVNAEDKRDRVRRDLVMFARCARRRSMQIEAAASTARN
jgi:hypothetical protein